MLLVVDTNAFINGSVFGLLKEQLYTVPEVLEVELRDKASREARNFPIEIRSPSRDSLEFVVAFAKKTGDFSVLSHTDIRLLALCVDLEREKHNGSIMHLRSEPVPLRVCVGGKKEKSGDNEDGSESWDGWITPSNIKDMEKTIEMAANDVDYTPLVACVTTDFAMQNLAAHVGLNLVSENGNRIGILKHWVLRCHACTYIEKNPSRQFCEKCGNVTLIRTSISMDPATGETTVHLKRNFRYNNRGTVYSIPAPQGGSASGSRSDMILREDQREYIQKFKAYERAMRKTTMDPDVLPSLMASSSTRESYRSKYKLDKPTIGYGRRNINQPRSKKS